MEVIKFKELRETVYDHTEGRAFTSVTASERWSIGMVNRLKEKFPDEVEIVATNPNGSILAHIPFEWMRIVPKKHVELSDERREALAERMRSIPRTKSTDTAREK